MPPGPSDHGDAPRGDAPHHGHDHGDAHGHGGREFDSAAGADRLEAEAELLSDLVGSATATVADVAAGAGLEVRVVLDVGAGPGVGTCHLAEVFPAATVVAVDAAPTMLERAAARAERQGLAGRVATHRAELPDGLVDAAGPGGADVLWASMVLHHVADQDAALTRFRDALRPGGLLALVERVAGPDGPDPALAGDLAELVRGAGFTVVDDRPVASASGRTRRLLVARA